MRAPRLPMTLLATGAIFAAVLPFACSSGDTDARVSDARPDRGVIKDPRLDPFESSVVLEPASVMADGVTSTKVTVTIRHPDRSPAVGVRVDLSVSGKGNKLGSASGDTNHEGTFTATLTSTVAETKTVTATFERYALSANVTFEPCHGKSLFLPPIAVSNAGTAPRAVAAADFNRDGKPDLAMVSRDSNDLQILLGRGDGTFSSGNRYGMAGSGPIAVLAADLTPDGKVDLAVVNKGTSNVSVFLGNGDGTFLGLRNFPTGTDPRAALAADLNLDGRVDLAIHGLPGSSQVSILLGAGDGSFSEPTHYAVGAETASLASGDFDKDGWPDLVAATHNAVAILFGNRDGKFAAATYPLTEDEGYRSVAVGDFTGDGISDIAVGIVYYELPNLIYGYAWSRSLHASRLPNLPEYLALAGDFDGDGKEDLLGPKHVLLGKGNGSFSDPLPLPAGKYRDGYETAAAKADFDGDGKLDIAITSDYEMSPGQLSILLNSGCVP